MKSLVLLDLDNVLQAPRQSEGWQRPTAWHLPDASKEGMTEYVPEAPAPARPAVFVEEGQGALPEDGVVVVIAFNQATAAKRRVKHGAWTPLRPEYLLRLAEATAAQLGISGEVRCEAIPVLTVPQSADGALLRALRQASSATVVGPFNQVVLVSADGGLRQSIRKVLEVRPMSQGREVFPFRVFELPARRPHRRQAPPGARLSTASPVAPTGWSARVERDEHIAAVQTRDVQRRDALQDFSSLARHLEERVELLSQLGPTRTSSRGVARLGACLNRGQVTLGPIHPDDGLEIDNEGFVPGRVSSLSPATFGPGAFRMDNLRATLPTRLPIAVLKELVQRNMLHLDESRLDRDAILRAGWPQGGTLKAGPFPIKMWIAHDKLFASVRTNSEQFQGWWLGDERAQSELSARIPSDFGWVVVTESDVSASLRIARPSSQDKRHLLFVAARTEVVKISPRSDGWELMTALVARDGGLRGVLLLLPPASELPRIPGQPFTVKGKRIQDVRWSESPDRPWPSRPRQPGDDRAEAKAIKRADKEWADFWKLLYRLPVLVACQHDLSAAVSR